MMNKYFVHTMMTTGLIWILSFSVGAAAILYQETFDDEGVGGSTLDYTNGATSPEKTSVDGQVLGSVGTHQGTVDLGDGNLVWSTGNGSPDGASGLRFRKGVADYNWAEGADAATILAAGGFVISYDWTRGANPGWMGVKVGSFNQGGAMNHGSIDSSFLVRDDGSSVLRAGGRNSAVYNPYKPGASRQVELFYEFDSWAAGATVRCTAALDGTIIARGYFTWDEDEAVSIMFASQQNGEFVDNIVIKTLDRERLKSLAGDIDLGGEIALADGIELAVATTVTGEAMDLSGTWGFRLDPANSGIQGKWYEGGVRETLQLPGCLQEQGFGNIPGPETGWWPGNQRLRPDPWVRQYFNADDFKIQAFLLPDRHYIGAAWYVREFEVPEDWGDKTVSFFMERCHWVSQVWLNGRSLGMRDSLAVPHVYELGTLKPGKHRLAVRIDNSQYVNVGERAHSVSEQTAGTWNGVVGRIELRADDPISIDRVRVFPRTQNGAVEVRVRVRNTTGHSAPVKLKVDAAGVAQNKHDPKSIRLDEQVTTDAFTELVFEYPMGEDVQRWDEFTPNRYELEVTLEASGYTDHSSLQFGVRDFEAVGRQFSINGYTTFLRGNTDCAVMPETGYAPMDVESWRKVWQAYKDFGLNMARFHSWCPPEAAFVAANEMGIYLAPEAGEWAVVNRGKQMDFLREDAVRILETYGHHPSFVIMGLGNERGGNRKYFAELMDQWRELDSTKLYTIKANSLENPSNMDFEVIRGAGLKRDVPLRYQCGWPPIPERSPFNTRAPQTAIDWTTAVQTSEKPLLQHETAQICAYPDIDRELEKYTGYLKASYLEIARDQLSQRGMLDQLPDFVEASGKWQVEVTREEFEAGFRTPELAGYHWLGLNDFTGQNTAPVGFTDAFYDPKSYVDPAAVRRWNGPTVLLARMEERILTQSSLFKAQIEISHHKPGNLILDDLRAVLRTSEGKEIASWPLPAKTFAQGNAQLIGEISMAMATVPAPAKLNLLVESPKHDLSNDWNVWVYPDEAPAPFPSGIEVVHGWDEATRNMLQSGKTVLMLPELETLRGKLPVCFTPFYWTAFGTQGGQSSAAGILLDPEHPLFSNFPTEKHANWQWWDLLTQARPMILDAFDSANPWPKSYRPLIQPIDSWKVNRKLGLVLEAKVGKGRLMICSIDLEKDLDKRPATRQFRKGLIDYLQSDAFSPVAEISGAMVAELFGEEQANRGDTQNLPTDG